ncbi:MAG: type VI secretion system tip protein VgrG [Verrucomicrobia bacterium]|nr:type VI secretion system tip protein VgrG [Verrucomicrobiota bacterium]
MPIPSQALRYLQLETSLGQDVLILTQASGHERLGNLFEITLEFTSQTGDLKLDDLLGTAATLAIHNAAENRKGSVAFSRYFNGYFSSISFGGYGAEGQARFHATLVPWLWFLTRTSDCRIFQGKSVPDILEEVFRDAGFSDFRKDLRGSYQPREFCVQYRETDFNFVSRLMECEGIYYYFEHANGSHKMVLCDDMVCHQPDPQHETIKFIGGAEARERKGIITDWNFSKQVKPGKFAHNDFNFTTPTPDPNQRLLARSSAPKPQKPNPYEIYDNHGGYETLGEGNRYARLRMEEIIADRETAQARTDIIGIKCGCKFKLDAHPLSDQNREYLITSVHWSAAEGGYGSGSAGGNFFDLDFSCIPADATFRPTRATPLPKIEGPQTATVCGPSGQEIYVDKHARVVVQFHWDRYGKADAGSSCWIRVSQPWAGSGFGGMAIPRIGQEVIVEFIEADPDRPIITGRVYNGVATPPYDLPANATRTTIKTNSSKGGGGFNELRFEDKKGQEQIFIHAERNRDLRVKKDNLEYIGGEQHLIVTKDHFEKIDGDAHLKVGGEQNEQIGESYSLKTGMNIFQKAGMRVAHEAGTEVHIKGGMNVVIEAGMMITLKAASGFITIGPSGVTISGPMVLINSGGAAGSGAGCSPVAPKIAKEADKAVPGKVDKVKAAGSKKAKGKPSPTAATLKQAAQSGTPFCEICAKAAAARGGQS